MTMSAKERAILDATGADLVEHTPALAAFLAEGPELLRIRGVKPKVVDGLVPGWKRTPRRTRVWRSIWGTGLAGQGIIPPRDR